MSGDRATVLVQHIAVAVAIDMRSRLSRLIEEENLVSPEMMRVLVDILRDELEGVGGDWQSLGAAAQRVVDRLGAPPTSEGESR
jgi:hypothetical protein